MDELSRGSLGTSETPTAALDRPISIKRIRLGESELEQRARKVGKAAGTVVALLRDAQQKINEHQPWKSTNPLSDLRTTARGRAQELRYAAALHAQEWRKTAIERIAEQRRQAELGYLQEVGQKPAGREFSFPMAAAAAVLGFLLGAGFKAWKARSRDT